MQHISTKKTVNSQVLIFKGISLAKLMAGIQSVDTWLADFELSVPKEIINGMVGGKRDSGIVQRVLKSIKEMKK